MGGGGGIKKNLFPFNMTLTSRINRRTRSGQDGGMNAFLPQTCHNQEELLFFLTILLTLQ